MWTEKGAPTEAGAGKLQAGLALFSSVQGGAGDLRQRPARPSSARAAWAGSKQEWCRRAPSRGRRGRLWTRRDVDGGGSSDPGRRGQAPSRAGVVELRPGRHGRPPPGARTAELCQGSTGGLQAGAAPASSVHGPARASSKKGWRGRASSGAAQATSARGRHGRAPPRQRGRAPSRSGTGELRPGAGASELCQGLARETSVRGGARKLSSQGRGARAPSRDGAGENLNSNSDRVVLCCRPIDWMGWAKYTNRTLALPCDGPRNQSMDERTNRISLYHGF
jgi:hypothetical protein